MKTFLVLVLLLSGYVQASNNFGAIGVNLAGGVGNLHLEVGEQPEEQASQDETIELENDDNTPAGPICPNGFTYLSATGSCYKVVFESHDWYSATEKCQEFSRGLVSITTAEEQSALKTFLDSEISNNSGSTACKPTGQRISGNMFWTSGQPKIKDECTKTFVWRISSVLEEQFNYTSWAGGEPNCQKTDKDQCVLIWAVKDFNWIDHFCSMKICPLCEHKP